MSILLSERRHKLVGIILLLLMLIIGAFFVQKVVANALDSDKEEPIVLNDNDYVTSIVTKLDANTHQRLSGAHLQFLDMDENVVVEWDSTTKKQPIVGMAPGQYILRETIAPEGYGYADDQIITIQDTNAFQEAVVNDSHGSEYSVGFKKVNSAAKQLGGVSLKLSKEGSSSITFSSDTENAVKQQLTPDHWTLSEELVPDGYKKADDINFTVNSDGSITIGEKTITDEPPIVEMEDKSNTDVDINIMDPGGNPLSDGYFNVYHKTDQAPVAQITGESTKNLKAILIPGETYTIRQMNNIDGYVKLNDITYTVAAQDTKQTIDIVCPVVTLTLKDGSGNVLTGGSFSIIDSSKSEVTTWTPSSTATVISGLEYGKAYAAVQSTSVDWYHLTDKAFTLDDTFFSSSKKVDYVITADKVKMNVKNLDPDSNYLSGCKLQILNSDKSSVIIDNITTTSSMLEIEGLNSNTNYYLHQVSTVDGYYLTTDDVSFTTSDYKPENPDSVTMNNVKTKVNIGNYDADDTTKFASGSSFTIINGETPVKTITNLTSAITIEGELLGGVTYKLHQTNVADGYYLGSNDVEFTVPTLEPNEGSTSISYLNNKTKVNLGVTDKSNNQLSGCHLQLLDSTKQNVIQEWDSNGNLQSVDSLTAGAKYYLRQTSCPDGYVVNATDVEFTIETNKPETTPEYSIRTQKTKVLVSKMISGTSTPLTGATLKLDDAGELWQTDGTDHAIIGLTSESTHKIKETVAPLGYAPASDVDFTVTGTEDNPQTVISYSSLYVQAQQTITGTLAWKDLVPATQTTDKYQVKVEKSSGLDEVKLAGTYDVDNSTLAWTSASGEFKYPGVYKYDVYQVAGTKPRVTYDIATKFVCQINVAAKDTAAGELEVKSITYSVDGEVKSSMVFTNSYLPASTTGKIEGNLTWVNDLKPINITDQDYVVDVAADSEIVATDITGSYNIAADGTWLTNSGTFSKAGIYQYTVKEHNIEHTGVTISTAQYTVTFTVTDNNGQLVAVKGVSPSEPIIFQNSYTIPTEYKIDLYSNGKTTTYNGSEQSVEGFTNYTFQYAYDGTTYNITVDKDTIFSSAKGTTAGPYTTVITEAEGGVKVYADEAKTIDVTQYFTIVKHTATLEIKKLDMNIKVTGNSSSPTYNRNEQTIEGFSAICTDGQETAKHFVESNVAVTGACAARTENGTTNMGVTNANCSYSDSNINPIWTVVDGYINIQKVSLSSATVTLGSALYYTGGEQTQTISTVVAGGLTLLPGEFVVSGNTGTVAGNFYSLTVTGQGNFQDSKIETWVINKTPMVIKIVGSSLETTYNGEVHTVTGYAPSEVTDTGLFDASKLTVIGDTVSEANATKKFMGLTASNCSYKDTNIEPTFQIVDGYVLISPKDITGSTVVPGPEVTYNGLSQEKSISSVTTNDGLSATYELSGNSGTNASDYTMTITGTSNFTGSVNYAWSIKKLPITISVTGDYPVVTYSGLPQSAFGYQLAEVGAPSGFYDEAKVTVNKHVVTGTDVGYYDFGLSVNDCSYSDNNISATFNVVDGGLTIAPVSIANAEVSLGEVLTYDGTTKTQDIVSVHVDNFVLTEDDYEVFDNSAIDPGSHVMTLKGVGNFCDTKQQTWLIVDSFVNVGAATVEAVEGEGAPPIKLETSNNSMIEMCATADELVKINTTTDNLHIVLNLEDAEKVIPEEAKSSYEDFYKENEMAHLQFISLNLLKWLESAPEAVTRLEQVEKGEVTVTVELPKTFNGKENSQNKLYADDTDESKENSIQRNYYMNRLHDGEIETLEAQFDADKQELTFQTDIFCDQLLEKTNFSLSYKDTFVPDPEPEPEPDPEPASPQNIEASSSVTSSTGDNNCATLLGFISLTVLSLCMIIFVRKRIFSESQRCSNRQIK